MPSIIRRTCTALIFSVLWLCSPVSLAQEQIVKVGGYVFPPFLEATSDGEWRGITVRLLAELNSLQSEYRFELYPTSAARRYADLEAGRYQLMFFENPDWGWPEGTLDSLRGAVMGREVFIARAAPGRDQSYFADHAGKRIALFSGYHYAFADFVTNKAYLRSRHNAIFTQSQESNVQMVLRGRAELAVVTDTWLQAYLQHYPDYRDQLLVSEQPDQLYQHYLVVKRGSTPDLATMQQLLGQLKAEGILEQILVEHGVDAIAE